MTLDAVSARLLRVVSMMAALCVVRTAALSAELSKVEAHDISIAVATDKEVAGYTFKVDGKASALISQPSYQNAAAREDLERIVASLTAKQHERQEEAHNLPFQSVRLQWALVSGDSRYIVGGDQNPLLGTISSIWLLRRTQGEVLAKIPLDGELSDIRWIEGSDSLVVLSSEEHAVYSLKALFSALSGHPVRMSRFRIRIVTAEGRTVFDTYLPGEILSPCAEFR